jgi:type III secretory pathway component EscT
LLLEQAMRGLPVALTAAVALWAATMAGAVIDDLRRATERTALPTLESTTTPGGALLGMLAAIAFLHGGGPARVAAALAEPGLRVVGPLRAAAFDVAAGIQVAVAVASPVIAAAIVWEFGSALMARAATPAFVAPLLAPLRSLVILVAAALFFERMLQVVLVLSPALP